MKTITEVTITIPELYRDKAYMRRVECANASGLSVDYFDRLAWQEKGPPFIKISKRGPTLYPTHDFFSWLSGLGKEHIEKGQIEEDAHKQQHVAS